LVVSFVMTLYNERYYDFMAVSFTSIFILQFPPLFHYFSGGLSPKLSALTGP